MKTCSYVNAVIHTMDENRRVWDAMYVEDGFVRRLGPSAEIAPLGERVVDLGGHTVLPGFQDSHLHMLSYGMAVNSLDGKDCPTKEAILEAGRIRVRRESPSALWLSGFVSPYQFTKDDLDGISTEIPVFYSRVNGHTFVPKSNLMSKLCCNSFALSAAQVSSSLTVDGGTILTDDAGPTGILKGRAVDLVASLVPWPTRADKKSALATAARRLAALGFSAVHTNDVEHGDLDLLDLFRELDEEGLLPLRVSLQCLFEDAPTLRAFLSNDPRPWFNTPRRSISAIKLILDGTLGDRTAALPQPYLDDPSSCGSLLYTSERLEELVELAHTHQLPVVMHTIGTAAIRQGLSAIEAVEKRCGRGTIRHGLVHCLLTEEASFQAMANLGVAALVQPISVAGDYSVLPQRIGPEALAVTYNWKTMLDYGILVAGSTDCPCDSPNPFESLSCAVTRQDLSGMPEGGFLPRQRLSLDEAITVMTGNVAKLTGEFSTYGSLEPGKSADFILLSEDIFSLPPQALSSVHCVATIHGGQCVHSERPQLISADQEALP